MYFSTRNAIYNFSYAKYLEEIVKTSDKNFTTTETLINIKQCIFLHEMSFINVLT